MNGYFDAAVTATLFHGSLPGVAAGTYEIQFPSTFDATLPGHQTSAAYGANIYLHSNDWNQWDVIVHEYGHLVAGDAGFFGLTGGPWAWDHRLGVNARVQNPNADPYDQMQLGFNEGWANFFSVVCQEIQGVTTPPVGSAGQTSFYSHHAEDTRGFGEDEELSVMAVLWDLFDTSTDLGKDNVSMGINDLFAFLDSHNPLTLDELWDSLISAAPNLQKKLDYGRIFELNHVSPELEGARLLGSTAAPSKFITVMSLMPAPVFQWKIFRVSDNSSHLLNRFGIQIFDAQDVMVYDTGIMNPGTGDGQVNIAGDVATFIPRLADWQSNVTSLVGSSTKEFRWIVYGSYNVEVEDTQSGLTSTLLSTGKYWSSFGEISVVPSPI